MPKVNEKNYTRAEESRALVHGTVPKGVVKKLTLAFIPRSTFSRDGQLALPWNVEAQVTSDSNVARSTVLCYLGSRKHHRKAGIAKHTAVHELLESVKELRCERTQFTVLGDLDTLVVEVEDTPAAGGRFVLHPQARHAVVYSVELAHNGRVIGLEGVAYIAETWAVPPR